ncbi:MAG: electron transfer flavoprotein subunit alpha/FixB family protein [Candidatus Latescibacteria bacterium]|nr:electron transfer flavoprotein subunit alpha/FixB family protein [bacterium]MBD3423592.1 electron transfer flavoprotein subunit alpha/FixB family protein [Candidatus Latescibacterota bacterium]
MMSDVLVFGEIREGKLKKTVYELMTAADKVAKGTGGAVDALLIGRGASESGNEIADLGFRKIVCVDSDSNYSTEGYAEIMKNLLSGAGYSHIFFPATSMGRDLCPRVASIVNGVVFSDCVDISWEDGKCVARRPVYSGKLYLEVSGAEDDTPVFITVRPNNLPPAEPSGEKAEVVTESSEVSEDMIRAIVTEVVATSGGRPDITEADIIISGGRGMKEEKNFEILGELADLLGGAVGASRAAVDAGYAPNANQVGQTGKIVNPKLYIACGISGAIQHLAGMRTSKVIVAINKDPNAPIFEKAHYGIVGDLFDVVPALTEEIRKIL